MECASHGLPSFGSERGCYTCLKVCGLAGGTLSRQEADFAGLCEPKPSSGGWHSPDAIPQLSAFHDPDTDDAWMSDEELSLLRMLADPPTQTGRPPSSEEQRDEAS